MPPNSTLSFAELDRRLREMPGGPSTVLDTPKPYRVMNIIGWVGAIIALLPFVLIRFIAPALWMVSMAQIGFAVLLLGWLPSIVRSYGVLGWTLWRWREDQVSQLDHDLPHFGQMLNWLSQFPEDTLVEHQRVLCLAHRNITAKIGLLAGSLDRLGILPVLVSAYLFLRNWQDLLGMPLWQLFLGFGLILLYVIIMAANLKRIRLQSYENLLTEALAKQRAVT